MKAFIMVAAVAAMVLSIGLPVIGDTPQGTGKTIKPDKPVAEKVVLTGTMIKNGDSYILVTDDCGSVTLPDPSRLKCFLTLDDYEKAVDKTVTMEVRAIMSSSPKSGKVIRRIKEILSIKSMTVGDVPGKM